MPGRSSPPSAERCRNPSRRCAPRPTTIWPCVPWSSGRRGPDSGSPTSCGGIPESVYANDAEFALASLHCTAERYDDALRAFERVDYATLSPEHRQRYDIRMGYIRFRQGDYDDALRYFRRIPSSGEYADHALYYISYIAYARGRQRHGQSRIHRTEPFGGLWRRGAVLSLADRVQRGKLPLCGYDGRRAHRPCGGRAAHRAGAHRGRGLVSFGRVRTRRGVPRRLSPRQWCDGPQRELPAGLQPLPAGALQRGAALPATGLRGGRCADAERLLPSGRLLPARRRQAARHAVVRHGGQRVVRCRDRRGRPVQLRQVAVRAGRGALQRGDPRAEPLRRAVSDVGARRAGARAADRPPTTTRATTMRPTKRSRTIPRPTGISGRRCRRSPISAGWKPIRAAIWRVRPAVSRSRRPSTSAPSTERWLSSGWARSPSRAATAPRPSAATRSTCTARRARRPNTLWRITIWDTVISSGATCRTPTHRSRGSISSTRRPTATRPMRSTARPMRATR